MRHVCIRVILALVWLAAAVICGVSGKTSMAGLYAIMCGIFLYSAYTTWKKEKDDKGDR